MSDMIYLGEDLGMGANKLWGTDGGLQVVSHVASNGRSHITEGMVGLRSKTRPMNVVSEFGSFYIGEGAHDYGRPVENLDFERLTGAPEMRALLYGSLAQYQAQYGPFDGPIGLMVGLPLQMMMGDSAKAYQQAVKAWLKGSHTFMADGITHQAEITQVRLTSQPVGALFDYVLNENGQIIGDRTAAMLEEVGVVSVGFNTVELLVVRDGAAVESFTAGNTKGVRRLLELMNRDGLYSLGEMDGMLRSGRIGSQLKMAMPIWAREVNGEIERHWGNKHRRFARVLVVGGGALLLKGALTEQFGMKAYLPDQPVMSIARGLHKLAVMKK